MDARQLRTLTSRWRSHAEMFRRFDDIGAAEAFELCANELEAANNAWQDVTLTLDEGASESGYSTDSLGRMIREERLDNAGVPGAPRILRRDLPRKPGRKCQWESLDSKEQIAAAVADSVKGERNG